MKKIIPRGFAALLILIFMIGLLPAVSLAADNELVLTKLGHSSTDTVSISDPQTRSVTLTIPFQYSGTTVNLSAGLIIDKAANIGTVVTSFDAGSTATIGGAPVVLTVTYYKGSDTTTQYSTGYSINVVRAAKKNPSFSGTITKSVTGMMPNNAINDITFTSNDFSNLYTPNDGGAITRISILGNNLSCGTLKMRSGESYTSYVSGDIINLSDIGKLVFDAVASGSVTYLVSAYSGTETATGSVLLNITVNEVLVPTISGSVSKSVNAGGTVTFALSDFSSMYNLNFGTLNTIEVTPASTTKGVWYNGQSPITGATVFTYSTISNLKFAGTDAGSASFTWRVSNEAGFSLPGSGTVTVKTVSVPTITAPVIKSLNYDSTLSFTLSDFSNSYNLNSGTLTSIVITPTNNSYGTWYKGSTPFTASTAFDAASIGSLKFKGTLVGQATFTFTVSNEKGTSSPGNGSVTINPLTAATTYSTAQSVPAAFTAADLNTACSAATGTNLNYIYFPTPTISGGVLYYGASSSSTPGTPVSPNTVFYVNRSPSISSLMFVPASNFSGTVSIPYNGLTANNVSFTGTVKINVSSTGVVTYTTSNNTPKTFSASDFITVSANTIGGTLSRIVITSLPASLGTLYYNYSPSQNSGTVVQTGTTFYPNSTPGISNMTFVPSPNFTGSAAISYTATNTNGASYSSAIVIKVTAPAADLGYTARSGQALRLSSSDINTVCFNATGANLSYVTFILPSASYGKLYYNYVAASTFGAMVTPGTAYYRDTVPSINNISFVPAATYTGSLTIAYTGVNVIGTPFSGKMTIQVYKPTSSIYFSDVGSSYDWAAAAIDYLYETGVVQGTGGMLYTPGTNMTRGEFMVMLYRVFGFTGNTGSNFADVPVGSYYYNAIAAAKALGIAQGFNNNFYPDSPLSRQDAMALIYRAIILTGRSLAPGSASDIVAYTDKGLISSYALTAVETLVKAGIIQGNGAKLNPTGNLSRAEMAVVVYRLKMIY